MVWNPCSLEQLQTVMVEELAECSADLRAYFFRVRFAPEKWQLEPWGDAGGGFWAVAADANRVLWWNDLEGGWNVSSFETRRRIPGGQYWCNQDALKCALPLLAGRPGARYGPPQSIPVWPPPD